MIQTFKANPTSNFQLQKFCSSSRQGQGQGPIMLAKISQCMSGSFKIDLLGTGLSDPTVFVESEELESVVDNLVNKGFLIEFQSSSLCSI